ncbi:MAG: Nicotinate-nucleotide adenylyltransferase [Verrucomicrobiae bacterium]|nr:Nicotinate-nucleotide adenylyltransferase [Verrucomicrobiae bacterium]
MATLKRKIGILGGTFNPIHLGHLLIAQDALEQVGLERVIFIPSATPPHKPLAGKVAAADRLKMVNLAIAGDPRFSVADLEIRRGGRSYSVETVAELRGHYPDLEFYFIIGADSLNELHLWREADRLVQLCRFIAVTRPGYPPRPAKKLTGLRYELLNAHPCEIASREIRARIAGRDSIRYLVPEAVRRYIERKKLYL